MKDERAKKSAQQRFFLFLCRVAEVVGRLAHRADEMGLEGLRRGEAGGLTDLVNGHALFLPQ